MSNLITLNTKIQKVKMQKPCNTNSSRGSLYDSQNEKLKSKDNFITRILKKKIKIDKI